MKYLITVVLKPNKNKYTDYTFKAKNTKHLHFMLNYVYKICYNNIAYIEIRNLQDHLIKTVKSNFNKITLQ